MRTDSIFYQLFAISPETFFLVLGKSADEARNLAARYQYEALEFKETAHRADGIFLPKEEGLPLYFLELQFYNLPSVFADTLAKAYTYLKQHDPGQKFCAVVLFRDRDFEPKQLEPYQSLIDSGDLQRYYLDEMPEVANAPLGLSILYLLRPQTKSQMVATTKVLRARSKTEIADAALRAKLVELMATVLLSQWSKLTREEVQAMLQLGDLRKSRIYQEAMQEGREEGREQGREEGRQEGRDEERRRSIQQLAARKKSAKEIADLLGLELDLVRKVMAKKRS
jgi:predicted transposase/invertase (TIGR01784 family)